MRTLDRNRRQLRLCVVSTGESEKGVGAFAGVHANGLRTNPQGDAAKSSRGRRVARGYNELMDEQCRGETPRNPEEGELERNSSRHQWDSSSVNEGR